MPDNTLLQTDNEFEEQHLKETVEIATENCNRYEAEMNIMRADIDEMTAHYHDDNPEIWVTLNNTITMYDNTARAFAKNARARNKPYFGRIIITDEEIGHAESLYIGRGGLNKGLVETVVTDWRAPISSVYYENGLGSSAYISNDGKIRRVELSLKRTFDIEEGKLNGYFDSEAASNDELLNKYLARNKQAVLGEIIATIQKEQNEIIRKSPYRNVLVQGAAGSGKTTVAMHRISFILYNYSEKIAPGDFYIIGSNRMLLNYITGVLPELDVEGIRQMTMEELFVRLIYEQWDKTRHEIAVPKTDASSRGSSEYFRRVKSFCDSFESRYFESFGDIVLNPRCFVEGIKDGKSGVYDRSDEDTGKAERILLMRKDYIQRFLSDNPGMSLQNKILNLNERLNDNVALELLNKDIKYTAKEKAAITRHFNNYFGAKEFKTSVFDIYDEFLETEIEAGNNRGKASTDGMNTSGKRRRKDNGRRAFDVYELAALAYIYKRTVEIDEISEAHHIVIDEAQDYGMMAYLSLEYCIKDCTYTVMGDISQNIRYDSGLNDWTQLRELLCGGERGSFLTLRKSYRNTIEISKFATDILDHGSFEVYPSEPIIRHGSEPRIIRCKPEDRAYKLLQTVRRWQSQGRETIAVICRDEEQMQELKLYSDEIPDMRFLDADSSEFSPGIMVLTVNMTKGLEFDAVLIYEPISQKYPEDDMHTKLLYVAATRALHELAVLSSGELTGLISNKISEDRKRRVIADSAIGEAETAVNAGLQVNYDCEADNRYEQNRILAVKNNVGISAVNGKEAPTTVTEAIKGKQTTVTEAGKEAPTITAEAGRKTTQKEMPAKHYLLTAPEGLLKPTGHGITDCSVKWINKQKDGIYLQGRAGIMRLTPIAANIVRITCINGQTWQYVNPEGFKQFRPLGSYSFRDAGIKAELAIPGMSLTVDKHSGAIAIYDKARKEIISERKLEPRYLGRPSDIELPFDDRDGNPAFITDAGYIYLNLNSSDIVRAFNFENGETNFLPHGKACFIDAAEGNSAVIIKEKAAILPIMKGNAIISRIASYGSFIMTEGRAIDYYVIVEDSKEKMTEIIRKLR